MDHPPDVSAAEMLRAAAVVLELQYDAGVRAVGAGIRSYLSGDAPSLDAALELRPEAGYRRPATLARFAERDTLLRRAADQFFPGNASHQARELFTTISRYATSSWPRERDLVPARASAVMPRSLTQAQP